MKDRENTNSVEIWLPIGNITNSYKYQGVPLLHKKHDGGKKGRGGE